MNFNEIKIKPAVKKVIDELGFENLTPIQEQSFALICEGIDVMGEAPTGTGKTAAYIIPMLDKIDVDNPKVQALILVPTRELVIQSVEEIRKFSKYMDGIKAVPIYGGQLINKQIELLKKRPQIIVSTPGRLLDHIGRHTIKLNDISFLVLDECDEMLNMGFKPDIDEILGNVVTEHQTILFSALISNEIKEISKAYQKDAQYLVSKRDLSVFKNIEQYYVYVKEDDKIEALKRLIVTSEFGKMFVFVRTKMKVNKIYAALFSQGFSLTYIHGDLTQGQRDEAMRSFRSYESKIMFATDIAARGLDIEDVDIVVNYDLPEDDEYYVHRIGRTGRVQNQGVSYSFVGRNSQRTLQRYEKLTNDTIKRFDLPNGAESQLIAGNKQISEAIGIAKGKLDDQKNLILQAIKECEKQDIEIDALTIAAALLKKSIVTDNRIFGIKEKPESDGSRRRTKKDDNNASKQTRRGIVSDTENQRFFINIGLNDGLNDEGLKKFVIKYLDSINEKDFLDVYLRDTYSFFELPKDKIEGLMDTLNKCDFGKRHVHVELSEARKNSDSKKNKERSSKPRETQSTGRRSRNSKVTKTENEEVKGKPYNLSRGSRRDSNKKNLSSRKDDFSKKSFGRRNSAAGSRRHK